MGERKKIFGSKNGIFLVPLRAHSAGYLASPQKQPALDAMTRELSLSRQEVFKTVEALCNFHYKCAHMTERPFLTLREN